MRSRRKGWGWGLVLGAVSIGGVWSAGDPWIGSWLRAATAQGAALPDALEPHRDHQRRPLRLERQS